MRTVSYKLVDLSKVVIHLGKMAENDATQVRIDAAEVFSEYPNAVPTLDVINPTGEAYTVEVTLDGSVVVWNVKDSSLTAEGQGEIQLTFTQNGTKVKSSICRTQICRSISGGGTPPDPVQDWLDHANEVLEEVEDAFPEGGTTGQVLAKKSDADFDTEWVDQGSGGTTDYTELTNKPQIGGVTLTGNKTLHDLGAAAESDIPDVSGFYTKPAGGIPASDIAEGVIQDPTSIIDGNSTAANKVWPASKSADLLSAIAIDSNSIFNFGTARTESATADGWKLNQITGLCSSDSNYKLVKYTVTAGDVIKVVTDGLFQFQTVASVPSTGTSNRVGKTYDGGTNLLEVPLTATYLIVSVLKNTGLSSVYDAKDNIGRNTSEIAQIKSAISDICDDLNIVGGVIEPTLSWTQGKYVNKTTDAITEGGTQLFITDYIEIPVECERIASNAVNSSVAWTIAFYDSSKTFIEGYYNNTSRIKVIDGADIPEGAKYLIITTYNSSSATPTDIYLNIFVFQRFAGIEDDISALQSELVVTHGYRNVLAGAASFEDNKFVNDQGNVVSNTNFCLIDGYFPVKPNTTYELYRDEPYLYSNAGHNWTFWDSNKNFLSYTLSGTPVTSPSNAAYLRFAVYISNTGLATHATFDPTNVVITEEGLPAFNDNFATSFSARPTFQGLKWIGIGDSITEDNFRATYHYWSYIQGETGLDFVNMGVSGTGYKAEGSGDKAFYKRVTSMATDADVITIFGGVNDIVLSNAEIGTASDTGTTTICGCVNETLDEIEELYPAHMPIGIISPLPCYCTDTTVNLNPYQKPDDDTCRMAQFVEQLTLICRHRGIPFLDLFHQSNLRPWHTECNAKYFSCWDAQNGDGLHPNGHGHRLIYRQIMQFVEKLIMQ